MVEMLDGLQFWTARDMANDFDFKVKRRKNSPLYQKLIEIQNKATNPSRSDIPIYEIDWEDEDLENDDKAQHWWHLLNEEEQAFLNESYKEVCRTYYEFDEIEDPLEIDFRYRFNPTWEAFKLNIAKRPKVEAFDVVDHGLVAIDFTCKCDLGDNVYKNCIYGDGDTPGKAIADILSQLKWDASFIPQIDYFDFSRRLRTYFGARVAECEEQYWGWRLEDQPSGVAKTLREEGWECEPEEPNREDFDSDIAFDAAFKIFDERWHDWNDINFNPQYHYRICLKFNVADNNP